MAKAIWNITINNTPHTVELEWTYWTGKRTIRVDGAEVADSEAFMTGKTDQSFTIDGEEVRVVTKPQKPNIAAFNLELHHGGNVYEPDVDER